MSACDTGARLLCAYVDDELVGEERRAFEAHLAGCARCRNELLREREMLDAIASGFDAERAPEALRARVEALAGPLAAGAPRPQPAPWLAAAAALVAVTAGAVWLARAPQSPAGRESAGADFVALVTDAHLRFARGQLPLDVRSDRPDEVSRWFDARVQSFHLALPQHPAGSGDELSRLVGGRLVTFHGDYAAYLAYRQEGDRPVSLLVASARQVQPSGGRERRAGKLTFYEETVAGLKVISWVDKGLAYALVSDASVPGEQSCLVCHDASKDRRHLEGFGKSM